VNNDHWILRKQSFVCFQFRALCEKLITIKVQVIKIRNYLQDYSEFVSPTADIVERVPRDIHQFRKCKYLFSWLHCKIRTMNTNAYFITFWRWGIRPANVRWPVWGSVVGWSSHVKDSVRRNRSLKSRKRKLEHTPKTKMIKNIDFYIVTSSSLVGHRRFGTNNYLLLEDIKQVLSSVTSSVWFDIVESMCVSARRNSLAIYSHPQFILKYCFSIVYINFISNQNLQSYEQICWRKSYDAQDRGFKWKVFL
jgi:hypothetical protein